MLEYFKNEKQRMFLLLKLIIKVWMKKDKKRENMGLDNSHKMKIQQKSNLFLIMKLKRESNSLENLRDKIIINGNIK